MAEIRVRNLESTVKEILQGQAARQGQNLEAYLRALLRQAALKPRQDLAERLQVLRHEIQKDHGLLSDSTVQIRQDRDTRG